MSYDDDLFDMISGDDPLVGYDDPLVGALNAAKLAQAMRRSKTIDPNALRGALAAKQAAEGSGLGNLFSGFKGFGTPGAAGSEGTDPVAAGMARQRQRIEHLSNFGDQPGNFLGCVSAAIAAGAAGNAVGTPVKPVRIIALTVDPGVGALFTINSILVGNVNILLSGDGIPASRFVPDAPRVPLRAPRVPASVPITVNVTNISGAAATFRGTFDVVDLEPDSCYL